MLPTGLPGQGHAAPPAGQGEAAGARRVGRVGAAWAGLVG